MAGDWIVSGIGAAFGALFGSFLNVCIVRLPKNESVVSPRSKCPNCGLLVAWYDNIPMLSWLLRRLVGNLVMVNNNDYHLEVENDSLDNFWSQRRQIQELMVLPLISCLWTVLFLLDYG